MAKHYLLDENDRKVLDAIKGRSRITGDGVEQTSTGTTIVQKSSSMQTQGKRQQPKLWARLTAESSGAYSWSQLQPDGSGGFEAPAQPRTGESNAYELNGATELNADASDGDIVLLFPVGNDRYAFIDGNTGWSGTIYGIDQTAAGRVNGTAVEVGVFPFEVVNGRVQAPGTKEWKQIDAGRECP